MLSGMIARTIILLFGTLYPAYASYKAVKTKNVKEYVKWMMYWIVFAFFTCAETICDVFVSWIPFYYELKILFVLWLLSPATKGSSILYRKFVHPQLTKREKEIDSYIAKASDQGYSALISLGSRGFNYATNIVLTTAIKGQSKIADHLRKSYSLNDLSQDDGQRFHRQESDVSELDDEIDNDYMDPKNPPDNRLIEESYQSEMLERELQGEEAGEVKLRRRKSLRSKETADLEPVEEEDNGEGQKMKKKAYSHKEDSVSMSSVSHSTPSTPTPVFPGYTPFSRYSRSSSWESKFGKESSSSSTPSWRSRSSYTPSSGSPRSGRTPSGELD